MEPGLPLIVALAVMGVITVGATVTGNQKALCDALGGTYTPQGPDICPGGSWANLVRAKPTQEPAKK